MFKAIDGQKNIVEAEYAIKGVDYYCPGCGNKLTLKQGNTNRAHFAHTVECPYPPEDKDYMSEWHIRMQKYFPLECRECYFDEGEKHRADVFIKDKNTVIEFQKSPIKKEDFERRTLFHLNAGRKIVWIFDESKEEPVKGDRGKLRKAKLPLTYYPFNKVDYQWLNRRRFLTNKSDLPKINIQDNSPNYAVCLYTGSDDTDCVHRIVHVDDRYDFKYITISIRQIEMQKGMDVDDFFRDEEYWISTLPDHIKQKVYASIAKNKKRQEEEALKEKRADRIDAILAEIEKKRAKRNL